MRGRHTLAIAVRAPAGDIQRRRSSWRAVPKPVDASTVRARRAGAVGFVVAWSARPKLLRAGCKWRAWGFATIFRLGQRGDWDRVRTCPVLSAAGWLIGAG